MLNIKAMNINEAYLMMLLEIFRTDPKGNYENAYVTDIDSGSCGKDEKTGERGQQRLQIDLLSVEIEHPEARPIQIVMPEAVGMLAVNDLDYIENYAHTKVLSSILEKNETYTYGSRIFEFPVIETRLSDLQSGIMEVCGTFNQFEWVINHFKKSPANNHCCIQIATGNDLKLKHSPCLRNLDLKMVEGKLNMTLYFRCIPGSERALVKDVEGIIRKKLISEISEGDQLRCFDHKTRQVDWVGVKNKFKREVEIDDKFIKIIAERDIVVTDNHIIFKWDRDMGNILETKAKDIKKGDYVLSDNNVLKKKDSIERIDILDMVRVFKLNACYVDVSKEIIKESLDSDRYNYNYYRDARKLPCDTKRELNTKIKVKGFKKDIDRFIHVNYSLGYLMGLFIGDGWFGKNRVSIALDIRDSKTIHKLEKCLDEFNMVYSRWENTGCYVYYVGGYFKYILRYIGFDISKRAHNKNVPDVIFNWSVEAREGVIDGWQDSDYLETISKVLMEDMSDLIKSVGSHHSIYRIKGKKAFFKKENRYIQGKDSFRLGIMNKDKSRFRNYSINKGLTFNKVKEVEYVDNLEPYVYDVEMEKNGNFLLNGIFVHNSWDLYTGFPSNLAAFQLLNEALVEEIGGGVTTGKLFGVSSGAHIYSSCWEQARKPYEYYILGEGR